MCPMICQMYFFVCTANSTDTIPEPLLNRMEVIQFPGYTPLEKFHIARRHLLPKAMKAMGIKAQKPEGYGWCPGENNCGIYRRVRCARIKEAGGCDLQECRGQTGPGRAKSITVNENEYRNSWDRGSSMIRS